MSDHIVASTDELDDGERLIVEIEGIEIGVFNIEGEYFAALNWCAHQGGPCAEGKLTGTQKASFNIDTLELTLEWVRDGKVLSCPWHGWEYDVTSGECLSNNDYALPSYPVRVEDENIIISIS